MHGSPPNKVVALCDIPQSLLEGLVARPYLVRLNISGKKEPILARHFCSTDE